MIVMGLDQHRAQISAEWLDTATGEVSRARVAPAHRQSVRRFLSRFGGQELEVALEATTGWRFVAEELRAIGAGATRARETSPVAVSSHSALICALCWSNPITIIWGLLKLHGLIPARIFRA